MSGPEVRIEHIDPDGEGADDGGRVALLTVRDPARRNAMTAALSGRLVEALAEVGDDPRVHAVVITGDDDPKPAFCAGGDLDELAAAGEAGPEALERIYAGFLALARCPLLTVAAVDGAAVGAGLNLALAADVRIAGESARFDPGFLRLGVHPGGGMTWMAQRLLGSQATTAMLLGGEVLDADRAVALGLALRVARGEGDGERSATVSDALALAAFSAAAPRELVVATKASVRATAAVAHHRDAVALELDPQLASLRSTGFAAGLERVRARTARGRDAAR